LGCVLTQGLTLKGKIYIKSQNKFIDTYPDLVCLRKHSLNQTDTGLCNLFLDTIILFSIEIQEKSHDF